MPGKIKQFADRAAYFFIKGKAVFSQKPGAKLLEEMLGDKWPSIESFVKQNSLNPKKEDDSVRIINYYNSL